MAGNESLAEERAAIVAARCQRFVSVRNRAISPANPIGSTNISAIRMSPETTLGAPGDFETSCDPVSYTHLTLPTN